MMIFVHDPGLFIVIEILLISSTNELLQYLYTDTSCFLIVYNYVM